MATINFDPTAPLATLTQSFYSLPVASATAAVEISQYDVWAPILPANQHPQLHDQTFTVLTYTGYEIVSMEYIDQAARTLVSPCAIYGVRIGCSFMMLMMNFLLARSYRKPIFIASQILLALVLIHSVIEVSMYVTAWMSITAVITGQQWTDNYSRIIANTVSVFYALSQVVAEIAKLLHVHILFSRMWQQKYITAVMSVFVMLQVALWTNVVVTQIGINNDPSSTGQNPWYNWRCQVPELLFAISTVIYSALCVGKLAMSVRRRHMLGMRQFSPVHVLFIFAFQSMVIPAVLDFIYYAQVADGNGNSKLQAIAGLVFAVLLPFSTLWAQHAYDSSSTNTLMERSSFDSKFSDTSSLDKSPPMTTNVSVAHKELRGGLEDDDEDDIFNYNTTIMTVNDRATKLEKDVFRRV